jgi:SAM-dependent methyltransferase
LFFSPEYCTYRKLINIPGIKLHCADIERAETFPFVDPSIFKQQDILATNYTCNYFDFVFHNCVIEHVLDDKKCIAENLRILKNDGKMIITLPYNPNRKTITHIPMKPDKDPKRHCREYGYDYLDYLSGKDYTVDILFETNQENNLFSADERRYLHLDKTKSNHAILCISKQIGGYL